MLQLIIPEREYFDSSKQEFVYSKKAILNLEHSLISISKWESKWKKPFLANGQQRTREESEDYVRCMSLNSNIPDEVLKQLTQEDFNKITEYIDDKCTATWFSEDNLKKKSGGGKSRGQTITSELIYYWMIAYEIPFECQKWHLNRLLTLIRICEVKNTPTKKMKKKDIYASNRALNEARKAKMGTRG